MNRSDQRSRALRLPWSVRVINSRDLSPPKMDIRPYADFDEQAVIALWREVFGYDAPHNDPLKVIHQKLAHERDLFFVATLDRSLIGTVMGGYDGHRGWVYSVAVDPKFRRRGIGAALMRHLEQALAQKGCLKINLQVYSTNAGVVDFYEALGYKIEERISMGKLLS